MLRLSFLLAFLACSIGTIFASPVNGEEPAEAFLEALRENGYYDVALEYLDDLEKGDLISKEFRSSLPFEKAEILIGSSSTLRDFAQIEKRLDEAQTLLTEYANRNKSIEVSARTLRYQGNLFLQRSNIYLTKAKSDRATESEKNELRGKSRNLLEQSLTSYEKARDQLKRILDPKSPDAMKLDADPRFAAASKRKRDQLRTAYTQVRLRLPLVTEQLADTYPPGSPNSKKLLIEAAAGYKNVSEKYRNFRAGLNATVYSARCQLKLGNPKESLLLLEDIFTLSDSLKPLKLEGYVLATDCWSQIKPYPYAEVVDRLEPAVKVLNRVEVRQPEWLRIQLELAKAKHASAAAIAKKGGPGANAKSKEVDREAARTLKSVARVPSPYRDDARALLSQWNVSLKIDPEPDPNEVAPGEFCRCAAKSQRYDFGNRAGRGRSKHAATWFEERERSDEKERTSI